MRYAAALIAAAATAAAADNLTFEDRVELTRGLTAEYATAKIQIPRSKKPLPYEVKGTWDKEVWDKAQKEFGPAARVGDVVQISKVSIEDDKLVLEFNGGLKSGRKWYERIEVGMGNRTTPIATGQNAAPGGTTIEMRFGKKLEPMKAADVKKLLLPLMDFEKRSATEVYAENLPPEIKKAIEEKRALEGMDKEQVALALGRPSHKSREFKDGLEVEDWVYGRPPGKIVFVTFSNNKAIKVKESYAGLGTEAAKVPVPR